MTTPLDVDRENHAMNHLTLTIGLAAALLAACAQQPAMAPTIPGPAAEAPAVEQTASGAPAVAPLAVAVPARPVEPIAPVSNDVRNAAKMLDSEMRRWLKASGTLRRDRYTYGMDVAPLMLYAALRGDGALYQQLLPSARKLIVDSEDEPYTQGFVLWRHKDGVKPEVSGSSEMLWMARALWAGGNSFNRAEDRALALKILDGYARHAYELQGVWLVRKYYTFETRSFAGLSVLPNYSGDFLAEAEKQASGELRGFAERSYAMMGRVAAPSGLLYPVIQPEVGATYPGTGVDVYAPNGIANLEDACAGAEGAVRGVPKAGKALLAFAADRKHRNKLGQLHQYYDAESGEPIGPTVLSGPGYACLVRLAVALEDGGSLGYLGTLLQNEMQHTAEAPQVLQAPLYAAGPMLLAAYAMGAFNAP